MGLWEANVSQIKGSKTSFLNIYCSTQQRECLFYKGLLLITVATLLIVALQARSAGRYHPAKPRNDGDGVEDWKWGKLGLQIVGYNALWKPGHGANRDKALIKELPETRRALIAATLTQPILQVIDWFSLSNDWSFFLVISHLWIHHGLIVFVWGTGTIRE